MLGSNAEDDVRDQIDAVADPAGDERAGDERAGDERAAADRAGDDRPVDKGQPDEPVMPAPPFPTFTSRPTLPHQVPGVGFESGRDSRAR